MAKTARLFLYYISRVILYYLYKKILYYLYKKTLSKILYMIKKHNTSKKRYICITYGYWNYMLYVM